MKLLSGMLAFVMTTACTDRPPQIWQALKSTDVYVDTDDGRAVKFIIAAGTRCTLSQQWVYEKDHRHKAISCAQGEGRITDDSDFRKVE
ncbi:MAG: hypothetical protein Q7T87_16725 [Polaromonas sp.]|nr:hypothetical protein [Polaromonas sp.]